MPGSGQPAVSRYLLRRLLQVVPLLICIVTLTFALIHTAPGDPATYLAGDTASADYLAFVRHRFELDKPLPQQYLTYVVRLAHGDMGRSFTQGTSVAGLIRGRLGATLLLVGTATLFATILGIGLGIAAAIRPNTMFDSVIGNLSLAGYSMPVFWLAQLLLLVFSLELGWFPSQGMTDVRRNLTGLPHLLDVARHLVLPVAALTVQQVAMIMRLTRVGILDVMDQEWITAARARGLSERLVIFRHALRNALLPVTTVIGSHIGFWLSGAVLTETVFGWPGLGRLTLDATLSRDYPVLLGILIAVSLAVVIANLATDLAYTLLDPRVRLA
jgi:ABC-type dipeptide/oligopeptide/nickel transport system permease component